MPEKQPLIECRSVDPFMKNGFLVSCINSGHAMYIDPGDEVPEILRIIEERGLELICVVASHGHLDHICGIGTVKEQWDVPIYLHQDDEFLYKTLREQGEWFGFRYPPAPPVDYYLHPSKQLSVGDLKVQIHHTPGHSPGSVSLQIEKHLFCGDVIFAGSIGRTDLPGGDQKQLLRTIRERVVPLGRDIVLLPGHGPTTTVGRELEMNPFLADF